jgi:hypothetical protein
MTTPNLGLQKVPANSLQPSIPINDSLQALDALVQLSVIALTATPPTTTSGDVGKRWLIDGGATGAWATHDGDVALCTAAGQWRFFQPQDGWRAGTSGAIDYRYDAAGNDWAIQAPLTNPMTVAGDLIVGGAEGVPTRLAAGTNGNVLKVVSGTPAWADEAAVGAPVSSLAITDGVVDVDLSLGDLFTLSLTANVTSIALSNPPGSGLGQTIGVRIRQDAMGGHTVALPASFRPITGSDTAVQAAANAYTILIATTFDNGTRWEYSMKAGGA